MKVSMFKTLCTILLITISRNLLTIYHKYCTLIGYHIHYLSDDRQRLQNENKYGSPFLIF